MKEKLIKLVTTMLFALVLTTVKAETVSVTLSREGTLAEKVLEQASSLSTVTNLTVSGPINENDWNCIARQMTQLQNLDLGKGTITFDEITTFNSNVSECIFPKGLKYLGGGSYNRLCGNLTKVTLNDDLIEIRSYAFENSPITSINFPDNLTLIGQESFMGSNIAELDLTNVKGESLVIQEQAFKECRNLVSVTLPEGLTRLNNSRGSWREDLEGIFNSCTSLINVYLPSTIEEISDGCFYGCTSLTNIVCPVSLRKIDNYAFAYCQKLSNIIFNSELKTIGSGSFYNCSAIESLSFPERIEYIGNYSFSGCTKLNEITFPEHLQTIGSSAFRDCSGLTKVTSLIPFPVAATNGIFSGIDIGKCTLVVPEWSAMLYKMAMGWSEFANIETVKTGDLASMTVTDSRYLPASVRPNGIPNVAILPLGSLTVRGESPFPMDEVTLGTRIGEGKLKNGYDENENYYEYYSPALEGAVLINDESNISAQSVRIKLESIGGTWGFISLPFDVKFSDITNDPEKEPSNFVFKYYDGERRGLVGTGGNWQEASNILKAGVGYIYQSQDSASIYLKATSETVGNICNKSNVKTILQDYASEDAEDAGWNFIGNPYPAYFDSHYIDFTAPITVWNGQGYDAISLTDDDFVLSPYQAFFVQKQSDGNAITFFAEGRLAEPRQTNSNSRIVSRVAKKIDEREIYNIYLSNGKYTDKCRIVINEQSKIGYDASNDAVKFFSDNNSLPQIYTIGEKDVEYSINERPIAIGEIELGVHSTDGLYTISSDSEQQIYLIDRVAKKTIDLSNSDYEFSADESDCNGRFAIRLNNNLSSLNAIDNITDTRIMVDGELLSIQCSEIETINIYSLDGVNIATLNGADSYSIKLSRGIYLVKTHNSVEKIIIR